MEFNDKGGRDEESKKREIAGEDNTELVDDDVPLRLNDDVLDNGGYFEGPAKRYNP